MPVGKFGAGDKGVSAKLSEKKIVGSLLSRREFKTDFIMMIIISETDSKISVQNEIKSFRLFVVNFSTSVIEFRVFLIRRPFLDTMLSFNPNFW